MHEHSSHSATAHPGIAAGPLLALMAQQAEAQRAAITAAGKSEAEGVTRNAQQEGAASRERSLRAAEAELTAAAKRGRERAEAEAHMLVLTTKDTIASEILDAAQAELGRVASGPGFVPVLERLLAEVLDGAGSDIVVLAPPAHVDAVKSWLDANGRGGLEVVPTPSLKDGVAVQDAAKTYRITNTLTARFDRQEGALRKVCLQQLFGGEN